MFLVLALVFCSLWMWFSLNSAIMLIVDLCIFIADHKQSFEISGFERLFMSFGLTICPICIALIIKFV